MKATAKTDYSPIIERLQQLLTGAATHIAVLALSFITSRAQLLSGMAPLGIAVTGGMPLSVCVTAALGSFIGYLIPVIGGAPFRYIAAIFAIVVIRFMTKSIKGIRNSPVWAAVITAAAAICSGAVTAFGSTQSLILCLAEGVIAGAGAYFLSRTARSVIQMEDLKGLSSQELACTVISINIILMGFYSFQFLEVSMGRILACVVIYSAARFGKAPGGAMAGVAVSIGVALTSGDASLIYIYPIGGLFAGIFAPAGRMISILSFIVSAGLAAGLAQMPAQGIAILIELAVGAAIFLIMPKALSVKIGSVFSPPTVLPSLEGLRRSMVMRLDFASAALRGVSNTVEEVSKKLSSSKEPNFLAVLEGVENDACRGCTMCRHCWEIANNETVEAMLSMTAAIRSGGLVKDAKVPINFSERCLRRDKVNEVLKSHYAQFTARRAAEQRISEMRGVVSDQFVGISDMLYDLSEEFGKDRGYDLETAERISISLKELDIRAISCACAIDKFGRMSIEIKLSERPQLPFNRSRIKTRIEELCGREFEPPGVNRVGDEYYINMCEKAVYNIDFGKSQITYKGGKMCGDCCDCFNDGRGRAVMIVSDGMGSGGRAAVDSTMAMTLMIKLLKAGFGYDCSLRIVNSAMMYRSSDESLATIDISCVDLFTGTADLLKAGAAPTIVRRSGRTGKAECKSLPAGILREIGFDKATVSLKKGDVILMMSDGAISNGLDWICAELEAWRDGSAKQLADHIATSARRRRTDGHEDDITVIAAIIDKAV